MTERIIFESEQPLQTQEIWNFLIEVGQKLKEDWQFNLKKWEEDINVSPKWNTKLEVKYEIENETKHKLEFEIEWKPNQNTDQDGKLQIS